MKNIHFVEKKYCTGCAACANICPVNAIKMVEDKNGFKFPQINEKLCTGCGLCYKKCPAINFEFLTPEEPDCYAVWAENELRKKSSSGGMFSVLAIDTLKKGGVVAGAAWNDDFGVEHVLIDSENDLYRLRSSKYIQSNISEHFFREIQNNLEKGKNVLFSGCPCQVAGLKNFLGKDYENLLTVDIVCHGVPSPKILKKYINEVSEGREIAKVDFRDKSYFGWSTITLFKFKDGSEYIKNYFDSIWYKCFLGGLIIRESCGYCKYAKTQRVGDITLGDFWQIHRSAPQYNDWQGTSLVLLNTKKGENIYKAVESSLALSGKMQLKDALPYNGQLHSPCRLSDDRNFFFEEMERGASFVETAEMIISGKRDVGIVGFWSANNFGSVITYYALKKVIESLGLSVGMVELPTEFNDTFGDIMSRRFVKKHYSTTGKLPKSRYRELNEKFNSFVVGSDQVWNPSFVNHYAHYMFLDFVDDNKRKIAYAASIGKEKFDLPYGLKQATSYYLNKFDSVSVREDAAVKTCKDDLNCDKAEHVLDPVWLCSMQDYDDIIKDAEFSAQEDFVFSYILDPTEEKKDALEYAVKKLGMAHYNIEDIRLEHKEGDVLINNTLKNPSMEDWLYCLKNCKFVITDSHHGMVFALIFNKPFICFANAGRTLSRFTSLFKIFGIENRLVSSPQKIKEDDFYFSMPNYKSINAIAEKERRKSLKWLSNALKNENVNKVISDYDILYSKIKNVGDNCWRQGETIKKLQEEIERLKSIIENFNKNL